MGQCHASLLPSRAVLRIGGADARKFLQGLVTNDIDKAQGGAAVHTGLLSPQGKILFDFFAVPDGDGFLIDVAEDKAAELMKRLGFYRLRAAVEIAAAPSLAVAAAWGGPLLACRKAPLLTPTPGCQSSAFAFSSPKQRMRPISAASLQAKLTITPCASGSACRKAAATTRSATPSRMRRCSIS